MPEKISRLQLITDDVQVITESLEGGVKWVQLRMKNKQAENSKQRAVEAKAICDAGNSILIINDFAELALEIDADGVHLGKEDMKIHEARKLLGDEKIIGGSTNSFEDILKAVDEGADYLGLGPFRFTSTKTDLNPILGLKGFEEIMNDYQRANLNIPIIAIGGIKAEDVEPLLQLGVYGVAVSAALNVSRNKKQAVDDFLSALNKSLITTN